MCRQVANTFACFMVGNEGLAASNHNGTLAALSFVFFMIKSVETFLLLQMCNKVSLIIIAYTIATIKNIVKG